MSGSRTGYGFALAASVLALVGSMAAVASHAASDVRTDPAAGAAGARSGMMGPGLGSGGPSRTSPLSCATPTDLPGTTVHVTLVDMGMSRMMGGSAPLGTPMRLWSSTRTVPAGQVSLVAANVGRRTHELVILPLADGQQAGGRTSGPDGKVDETGSLGEASTSCGAGVGEGITSGSVGWVSVTLPAGRYELLCNEPDHYADGMWQELDVTG